MALDNYANLRESIKRWSHREDVVGEIVDDCITMAEQEIYFGAHPVRLTEMVTDVTVSNIDKSIPFPDDMVELLSISIDVHGDYLPLAGIPIEKIPHTNETGCPTLYSIGSEIILDVTPDKTYSFRIEYYKKPASLSDDDPTNAVLTKYPNIYLFGGVAMAMMWAGEEDRMNEYVIRMRDVISNANTDATNLSMGALPNTFVQGFIP